MECTIFGCEKFQIHLHQHAGIQDMSDQGTALYNMKIKLLSWFSQICCSKIEEKENTTSIQEISIHVSEALSLAEANKTNTSININKLSVTEPDKKIDNLQRFPTFGNPTFSDLCQIYISNEESTGGTNSKNLKKEKKPRKKQSKRKSKSPKNIIK